MSITTNSYALQVIADRLSYPTSMAFDEHGNIFIAEAGLPFGGAPPGGTVLRIAPDGERTILLTDLHPPVNGLTYYQGSLYISEGGHPAQISRLDIDGNRTIILENLPGPGNYHTNMVAFGQDGLLYFSQGAMTNLGVIGLDAYELGWLRRLPHAHDIPGMPINLVGRNFTSPNPLLGNDSTTQTGAFIPFGSVTTPHQRLEANLPCTAAIMRCHPDGSHLELFAWGIRNAYGIGFLSDGRLIAVDQGADDRGSRPIGNAPDLLFHVQQGAWYGWPDFVGSVPVTDPRFMPTRGPELTFLLENHAELPPPEKALVEFPPHVAATKFAVMPHTAMHWAGHMFVALFGDEAPMTAPSGLRVGRSIVRIDPTDWTMHQVITGDLLRPIDVAIDQEGKSLYILDFGHFEMQEGGGVEATPQSGKLWRLALSPNN